MATEADFRLPRTVIPHHYAIRLEPDLPGASFAGSVDVGVSVDEPTSSVVMNALDLVVSSARVTFEDRSIDAVPVLDEDAQRVMLELPEELPMGPAVVHLSFTGVLNDMLRGFYRSTYTDDDGTDRTIATTQFEATDARRAFPCWDEPDLKATYSVTLVVDEGLAAVSNASEVSRTSLGHGRDEVIFAETMKMSTYLVAFVVGDLEFTAAVDVDGTPLRIVAPPGKLEMAKFALEAGEHCLRFFADYYDVPYPGDKLDMVAIPDFAWGAMENLGCITYRETALLLDLESATQLEMMRVASVIAHEIAHMWFGDLVTMKWWNGVWLNEAFATFAENKATDTFRPEWNQWLFFSADRARSQETDALQTTRPIEFPVASPSEADAMFDVLTYEKGSSVLRMLERYLGEETFRKGVSHYLQQHSFSNTDNEDLWASLEAVSDVRVGEIMDTWIFQGGFPAISAVGGDRSVTLSQKQFRYFGDGDHTWEVPVLYSSDEGEGKVLIGEDPVTLAVGADLVVNAGGEGFFRVDYDQDLLGSVMDRLDDLDPIERYSVICDTFANVLAGKKSAADYLDLVGRLGEEEENDIWGLALSGLGELDRIVSSDDRDALRSFTSDLLRPKAESLGWTVGVSDTPKERALRGQLFKAMGTLARDQETIDQARHVTAQRDPNTDAEIADAALAVAAANGDLTDFGHFLTLWESATTPQLTVKYLRAAVMVPDPEVPAKIVDMVINRRIRNQDSFWVLALLIGHKDNGARAWRIIADRWDDVLAVVPASNAYRILDLMYLRSEPDVAAEIETFLETHGIEGAEMATNQRLEQLKVRVALRAREGNRIGDSIR